MFFVRQSNVCLRRSLHTQRALPYRVEHGIEGLMTSDALRKHYEGVHFDAYADLNRLTKVRGEHIHYGHTSDSIIRLTALDRSQFPLYNAAAATFNHNFFFSSVLSGDRNDLQEEDEEDEDSSSAAAKFAQGFDALDDVVGSKKASAAKRLLLGDEASDENESDADDEAVLDEYKDSSMVLPDSHAMRSLLQLHFGSEKRFFDEFAEYAMAHVGYGWTYLLDVSGHLQIVNFANNGCPLAFGQSVLPLLALDMWEHSYIVDYGASQEGRRAYVDNFLRVINWEFVEENCAIALQRRRDVDEALSVTESTMIVDDAAVRSRMFAPDDFISRFR
jgi:superoxide dismutase